MMLHAFGQLSLGNVTLEADDMVSKFVTPNGHINLTVDGLSFVPDTIPAKKEGGKARKKRMNAEDANILALHALSSDSKAPIIVYGNFRERRMLENAITRLQKAMPRHEHRDVINHTPVAERLNPIRRIANMVIEGVIDVNGDDNRAFNRLFGNALPQRQKSSWNPLSILRDMVLTPVASAFSSSRSIKSFTPVPTSKAMPVAINDSAANAVVQEAMGIINQEVAPKEAQLVSTEDSSIVEEIAHDDDQRRALDISYADIVTPAGSYMSKEEIADLIHIEGSSYIETTTQEPEERCFAAVDAALTEITESIDNETFDYDRFNLIHYIEELPWDHPLRAPQTDGTEKEEPGQHEFLEEAPVAQKPEDAVVETSPDAEALPVQKPVEPEQAVATEVKIQGRITGLSRMAKRLVANMICQNPGMFEGQSVQSLNAIISAIPGLENRENSKICVAVAQEMQNRGLVKLADINGELVVEKVVSVVSPNKYFNTILAQSIAPHKDFWVGQGVEAVQAALQQYWNMDEDAASYVAAGIWKEMEERNVFAFDANGKVARVADISNVPPLRKAYEAAAKMPPAAQVPISEQVQAFDASATGHDNVVDIGLVVQASGDYDRQVDQRQLAAE